MRIEFIEHRDMSPDLVTDLRALFDDEYLAEFGDWDPDQPYGYAPHDHHVIALRGGEVVGHVGWGRRLITVGNDSVMIAGVGGVLVSRHGRGQRLGSRLMNGAARSMRAATGVDFGYLGCDEAVVPFYESCGWRRIRAHERWVRRDGIEADTPAGPPILVLPIPPMPEPWPPGDINLHGRPW